MSGLAAAVVVTGYTVAAICFTLGCALIVKGLREEIARDKKTYVKKHGTG